jgi:hypothetical protein
MFEVAELVVGQGDHTAKVYTLTKEHLRNLCADAPRFYALWGSWK